MAVSRTEQPIYAPATLEFVAVANTFCELMQGIDQLDKRRFLEVGVKLLPLLYMKAVQLPEAELVGDGYLETFASETQYGILAEKMAALLGEDDAYLDLSPSDVHEADTPVASFISEDLADIWQYLYNFIEIFRVGFDDTMNDALYFCREQFASEWGQTLLNALRAIHAVKFAESASDSEELDS